MESYSQYASGDWTHFKTKEREYNIIGLVPSVLLGSLSGLVVQGVFPEYYVFVRIVEKF